MSERPPDLTPKEEDPFIALREQLKAHKTFRHRWPYYKETFARAAMKIVSDVTTEARAKRYAAFGISVETLRSQFYQGLEYAIEYLDPDGELAAKRKGIRCRTDYIGKYIEVYPVRSLLDAKELASEDEGWRDRVLNFLEESTRGAKFHLEVTLSSEDQAWLRSQLEPLGEAFIYQITPREVTIIKDI